MERREIEKKLIEIGGHVSNKGFQCIVTAVELISMDPGYIGKMTKSLYPEIAKITGNTPSSVERCMRHEIGRIYSENFEMPKELVSDAHSGKLTNREFLARFAKYYF